MLSAINGTSQNIAHSTRVQIDVKYVQRLSRYVSLKELRGLGGAGGPLEGMLLLTIPRLSVQPVAQAQWDCIMSLQSLPADGGADAGTRAGAGAVRTASSGKSRKDASTAGEERRKRAGTLATNADRPEAAGSTHAKRPAERAVGRKRKLGAP